MAMLCDMAVDTLSAGSRQLLHNARNDAGLQQSFLAHLSCRLRLKMGARHVLLGKNGCGKTTLLKAVASQQLEGWPRDVSAFLVGQEAALDDRTLTPVDAVLAADVVHRSLCAEASSLEEACALAVDEPEKAEALLERLNDIYEKFGDEDESQRSWRAESVLRGLGFDGNMLAKPLGHLSGGWQVRAALAAGLFMRPDLLLLDEPTNHLDLHAINWLQEHLADHYPGTILCVSHDRAFINEVATVIIAFNEHSLDHFDGNLDDFDTEASKSTRNLQRQAAALEKKREHIQKSIDHMVEAASRRDENCSKNIESNKYAAKQGGHKSSKASGQVAQRVKKLGRIGLEKTVDGKKYKAQEQEGPRIGAANNNDGGWVDGIMTAAPVFHRQDPSLQFKFEAAEALELPEDEYILELHDVSYTPTGLHVPTLVAVDLAFKENCRIGCIGTNGAGKSTLLKLLSGQLPVSQGDVSRQPGIHVSFIGQHDAEDLRHNGTAMDHLRRLFPGVNDNVLLKSLEDFGISGSMVAQPMADMSGGERVRVLFAQLNVERPHLLVLDEPTNHLDIYAIEALTAALKQFQGGVIFVTHHQSLLREVAEQILVVDNRRVSMESLSTQVLSVKHGALRIDNATLLK